MKALLVDDDPDLVDLLTYALRREGYQVVTASDGQQALARWRGEQPDIVLLDGNLPKMDGFEVCRQIRHESTTPVILLTARGEEADVVRGLQVGADDYVTKPFSAKQLVARMQAVLRRSQRDRYRQPTSELRVGDLVLDLQAHTVTKLPSPPAGKRGRAAAAGRAATQEGQADQGEVIGLTRLEFRILYLLAMNEGRVVPYTRLIEYAWGYYDESNSTLLKTHISHLRRKLGLRAEAPGGIRSVVGVGYMLARSGRSGAPIEAPAVVATDLPTDAPAGTAG